MLLPVTPNASLFSTQGSLSDVLQGTGGCDLTLRDSGICITLAQLFSGCGAVAASV